MSSVGVRACVRAAAYAVVHFLCCCSFCSSMCSNECTWWLSSVDARSSEHATARGSRGETHGGEARDCAAHATGPLGPLLRFRRHARRREGRSPKSAPEKDAPKKRPPKRNQKRKRQVAQRIALLNLERRVPAATEQN